MKTTTKKAAAAVEARFNKAWAAFCDTVNFDSSIRKVARFAGLSQAELRERMERDGWEHERSLRGAQRELAKAKDADAWARRQAPVILVSLLRLGRQWNKTKLSPVEFFIEFEDATIALRSCARARLDLIDWTEHMKRAQAGGTGPFFPPVIPYGEPRQLRPGRWLGADDQGWRKPGEPLMFGRLEDHPQHRRRLLQHAAAWRRRARRTA